MPSESERSHRGVFPEPSRSLPGTMRLGCKWRRRLPTLAESWLPLTTTHLLLVFLLSFDLHFALRFHLPSIPSASVLLSAHTSPWKSSPAAPAGSFTFTSGGGNNMADGPSHMPFHLLQSMTDNFSEGRLLGSGSYGKVYLGEREDGQTIAVKILHDMSGHDNVQFDKEFYNLVNLQHQNIVQLVGYCNETQREYLSCDETKVFADVTKRALCFEFMENGSLSDCLFDELNGHGWRNRYAMIKGICNGLKYLHEELKPPIFHLDLKPANILLDKKMIPKIADFGLSRFFKEEKSYSTNSPIGTFGYLPPEFIHHRIISNKLDIFSLGVVVIKIIAGPTGHRRSAEMTAEQFTEIVHGNWRNRLQSAGSGDLLESYSEQVKICMKIALSCLEAGRQKRPTIGDIVNMLTETEALENYHGMSTCVVKGTELIDVHPLQLHFSFRPNKFISCPFHVTNNMDDQYVSVRCVPKLPEAYLTDVFGVVPPRSTHTFVVTMKQAQQLPANMDVLDIFVETILGDLMLDYSSYSSYSLKFKTAFKDARKENSRGFRKVTLKAVCATTSKTTTSEVMLQDIGCELLMSVDVHPTEPWILVGCFRKLVIWNYKTQRRMMEREFPSVVFVTTVRFIMKSTEQLFVVGDDDGYIHVHDCMTMKRVKEFKAHGHMVTSFAVHQTQPFVLSASLDLLIKLWNWEKGWECIRTFTGHSGPVHQVKFNPHDANTFASASEDGTVKIWRIFSPTHFTSLDCEEGQASVDYYPTGGDQQQHYMVTGSALHGYGSWRSRHGTARIWDLRTQTCIREIKELQRPCILGVIDCHPDRPAVLVNVSKFYGVSLIDSTTYRSETTTHFGLGNVKCFAYIKGIRSLVIVHDHGVAIMGIDEFSKNILPPAR